MVENLDSAICSPDLWSSEYFGPFSKKLGVTVQKLNSFTNLYSKEIPVGLLNDLRNICHSDEQCLNHLIALTGENVQNFNKSSLRRKIKDTIDKIKKMKKNKDKNLNVFLETTFKFPEKKEMRLVSSFEPHQQPIAHKVIEKTRGC
jgi:hypothetical protein